jgi:hypothetical protein
MPARGTLCASIKPLSTSIERPKMASGAESPSRGRIGAVGALSSTHARSRNYAKDRPSRSSWTKVVPRSGLQLALFILVVLSISRIHQHFGIIGAMRPALVLLIIALIAALIRPSNLEVAGLRTFPARVVAGLVLVACV